MSKCLVTGAGGFLGKHLILWLEQAGHEVMAYHHADGEQALKYCCEKCDFVFHLAGVNRPKLPKEFEAGNAGFTEMLVHALKKAGNACPVIFASSIQAGSDNPYGRSKQHAENILLAYGKASGADVRIYRLPNVFGKWCSPNYNSAVATFCHNQAHGLPLVIHDASRSMEFVHVDDVMRAFLVEILREQKQEGTAYRGIPVTYRKTVGEVAMMIQSFGDCRQSLHVPGQEDGWHDAAFFNMCRPLEMVFTNGVDNGELASIQTGDLDSIGSYEDFKAAYKKQMDYNIALLVNADNAIDRAHAERCPLPFESALIDDCISKGIPLQQGGAHYNFTGPQGFGIANVADSLYAVKTLVFEQKRFTLKELAKAMAMNYGQGFDEATAREAAMQASKVMAARGEQISEEVISSIIREVLTMQLPEDEKKRYEEIREMIIDLPHYGNDIDEVDTIAREAAYYYTKPLPGYKNPRGGIFQAGLYPVSANVPLGMQTGATPDGRLAHTPVADGVSPTSGYDLNGPTASCNSVARLDHADASNGTLFNMKIHPTAMNTEKDLEDFVSLVRGFFDQKGMHMQFNVVDRETLIDAQKHPEKYAGLVVRVAGYSALFTTLSKSLQDDIIRRTEQGLHR